MKWVDEFRNRKLIEILTDKIKDLSQKVSNITIMEVCGTHTVAIQRSGLKELLPPEIDLISGPGCPVCVTEIDYIDRALLYMKKGYTIFSFGDMIRVPGSRSSLEKEKAQGKLFVVYSALEALEYARDNLKEKVLFLAVGFETTIPTTAAVLWDAKRRKLNNFFLLCAHKLIPPALEFLLNSGETKIDAFILPGHVSTIIGLYPYSFLMEKFKVPAVISGFEPLDILESIYLIMKMIEQKNPQVLIQYRRVVRPEGNPLAKKLIRETFEVINSNWRGIGIIAESGLKLNKDFQSFDIEVTDPLGEIKTEQNPACRCGDIIKGLIKPLQCPLFGKSCRPENPYGPCMVSSEGTCSAYYKYCLRNG